MEIKIIMFRVLFFLDLTLFINVIIKNIIKNVTVIKKTVQVYRRNMIFLIIIVDSYYFFEI